MLKPAVLALVAFASPAAAQMIGGNYTVDGTNPGGAAYSSTVDIAFTADECVMTWSIGAGQASGGCMQLDGILAASYASGDALTLVMYRVQEDGTLDGIWSVAGKPGTGTEFLTPN